MSNIEEAKSAVDIFELPCGYVDGAGRLHTSVEVREMTGEEEEILAARNAPPLKKFNKVIARCVAGIGDIHGPALEGVVPELLQGDRMYLMFAIRRVSLGDDMPFEVKCSNEECGQINRVTVSLAELTIRKMPDPTKRVYETTLPKSKKIVRMFPLNSRGEEAISKASTAKKDIISTAIWARIDSFDGKPCTIEDIKKLALADRNHLKDFWQDFEGGVDTEVDVQCDSCEQEFKTEVQVGSEGFFNPLAISKRWKATSST